MRIIKNYLRLEHYLVNRFNSYDLHTQNHENCISNKKKNPNQTAGILFLNVYLNYLFSTAGASSFSKNTLPTPIAAIAKRINEKIARTIGT